MVAEVSRHRRGKSMVLVHPAGVVVHDVERKQVTVILNFPRESIRSGKHCVGVTSTPSGVFNHSRISQHLREIC
jgi:hypothetical protein